MSYKHFDVELWHLLPWIVEKEVTSGVLRYSPSHARHMTRPQPFGLALNTQKASPNLLRTIEAMLHSNKLTLGSSRKLSEIVQNNLYRKKFLRSVETVRMNSTNYSASRR